VTFVKKIWPLSHFPIAKKPLTSNARNSLKTGYGKQKLSKTMYKFVPKKKEKVAPVIGNEKHLTLFG